MTTRPPQQFCLVCIYRVVGAVQQLFLYLCSIWYVHAIVVLRRSEGIPSGGLATTDLDLLQFYHPSRAVFVVDVASEGFVVSFDG